MTAIQVRGLEEADWPHVRRIYAEGIATGHATFEPEPPTWHAFDNGKHSKLRLVAVDDGTVIGWAAASPVSSRPVYAGVVEHSVYIANSARGGGVGHLLLAALVNAAEQAGIWTIQSSIFPENTASLRLHEKHGFRVVGRREHIALMAYGPLAGSWRDTILIERRSSHGGASG
ncbi:GNAT family N-acetyltransferase [Subtercola frigoramans]|uniref:Phosphinothricin acetyltransferase n=1 Tax=Subtercola frigoramans TaxID=120298 RepID=A0ABS2L587_9MICO|nr:GNAT family N-acetyltransferase [Subtercola frigoramans]MBM7472228.1 phosphinothricin acetyltransferase [Subtercola frigoramans]